MHSFYWILGLVLGAVWLSRLIDAAIGIPTVADITQPAWDLYLPSGPSVAIVVPARDEEECIQQCLSSLLQLDYPDYKIIAVNDRSTDCTGQIMDDLATSDKIEKLSIVHVSELPSGWLGKTHAMWTAAAQSQSEWILFTDGDVIFQPDALRRSISYAEKAGADHLVLYPTIDMHTPGERMMISFFQIMFVFGYRAWKVADPKARDHMGVGAFNLIRRSAYDKIGTYKALRMNVIDDINLGRLIKEHGFAQRNVFGPDLIRLRWAKGALGVVGNLNKNFFALMRFNWLIALLAGFGLLLLNLGPFLGSLFAPGWSKIGFVLALVSIFLLYVGASSKTKVSPVYFVAHPISSLLSVYILMRSAASALFHGGVIWRGTKYSLKELRDQL